MNQEVTIIFEADNSATLIFEGTGLQANFTNILTLLDQLRVLKCRITRILSRMNAVPD